MPAHALRLEEPAELKESMGQKHARLVRRIMGQEDVRAELRAVSIQTNRIAKLIAKAKGLQGALFCNAGMNAKKAIQVRALLSVALTLKTSLVLRYHLMLVKRVVKVVVEQFHLQAVVLCLLVARAVALAQEILLEAAEAAVQVLPILPIP